MKKTALVTGLHGFLGGHVGNALVQAGWVVRGMDRARLSDPYWNVLIPEVPNAVVHLGVNYGGDGIPTDVVVRDNVERPLKVLEDAIAKQVPVFVNADTTLPSNSLHRQAYALSKHQFAEWGRALCRGTGTRFVNVGLHHVYGPGDRADKFTSTVFRKCLRPDGIFELTSGEQQKDFVHASDVAEAFLCILEHADALPAGFTTLECGSGRATSVREFVELAKAISGSRVELRFGALPSREGEPEWCHADLVKLRSLGWSPKVSLVDGMRTTLDALRGGQ